LNRKKKIGKSRKRYEKKEKGNIKGESLTSKATKMIETQGEGLASTKTKNPVTPGEKRGLESGGKCSRRKETKVGD